MKTRFVAYSRLGGRRGVLSDILEADFVPAKNELPTLTLSYPWRQPKHEYLEDDPEVAFEYFHNNEWIEPLDARFTLTSVDFDYLEEVETRKFSFIGIGEAVRGVYVYGTNGLKRNDDGKVQFGTANAGSVMSHVWDYAQDRGWKGFTKSFNATTDSAGKPWKTTLSISFDDDTSLESILLYFTRSGLIDYAWEGRTLHVYNADTGLQRDLTTGTDPLRFSLSGGQVDVDSAPEMNDHENMATHVVVAGEGGLRWVFPTGAVLPEGRREVFLSYSGVDDEGTARILAAPTIAKYSNVLKNTTRQFQLTEETKKLPFINYRNGDWVLAEKDNGEWERVQVYQLAITVNANGVQGYVGLGDKIDSLLERLNESVQRIQGGTANEGTKQPEPSSLAPSAPTDLVATTQTLSDRRGVPMGVVGINFAHDGRDIFGDFISMDRYEIQYRKVGGSWSNLFMLFAPTQAGSYSWLVTQDEEGNLLSYEFRVIAYSSRQVVSKPSNVFRLQMKRDATPPGVPAKPTVKASFGSFEISTTHRITSNDNVQPNDYSHVVVQMSTTAAGPWVDTEVISPPMTSAFVIGQGYSTRWFRLISVDTEGNRSEPSESANGTTTKLVDTDLILSEIDAAKTEIKNAGEAILASGVKLSKHLSDAAAELDSTQESLDTVTGRVKSAEDLLKDVGSLTYATGQTLRQKLVANDTAITDTKGDLTKLTNRVTPLESGLDSLNKITIPGLVTSIDGKSTIRRGTADPVNNDTYTNGDRYEKWSTLGTGGKLLQTWRHDGSKWVAEIMDASYLPLIDIGSGTFGSLSGGRLTVGSVSADKVMIGLGDNMLVDPYFENDALNAERIRTSNWTIGQNEVDGKYLTFNSDTGYDIAIGNSARTEAFPMDANGVWALTYEASGMNRLQAYLLVAYSDGTSLVSNGTFLSLPINANGSRTRGTVYWDLSQLRPNGALPQKARLMLRRTTPPAGTASSATNVYYLRLSPATNGELIVNGSITGDLINGESVAAKVGTFLKLGVDQLVVAGTANMQTAVADKIFANIFASNKLTTNQLMVGKGENLIPWLVNGPAETRTTEPHAAINGGHPLSIDSANGLSGGACAFTGNTQVVPGTYLNVIQLRSGVKPVNNYEGVFEVLPNTKYKISVWVKASGTYSSSMPNARLSIGIYNSAGVYVAGPWNSTPKGLAWTWQELVYEFTTGAAHAGLSIYVQLDQPGTVRIDQPSFVKDGASLIATGGIVADHITASEEMSAKIGKFLTLDVGKLTATGTSTLATAVIDNLWANVVRSRMITTDMLLVGRGQNLIPNGDLAVGREGWDSPWGHYDRDPSAVKVGFAGSLWVNGRNNARSRSFPVKANTKYQFTMWSRADVANKRFYAQLMTDNEEATNPYVLSNEVSNISLTEYTGEVLIPERVTSAYLQVYANHTNGATVDGYQWFTGFELLEKNAASLIVEGGIVTKQLKVTEDMTVKLLSVHKVEAGEINVNSLTSDIGFIGVMRTKVLVSNVITTDMLKSDVVDSTIIKANAITAKHTITGAVFQTDAKAATGVQIDSVGLRAWNASGGETIRITRTTGDVTVTGGTVQTSSAGNRGIKLNTQGLYAYSSKGNLKFLIDAAEGDAQFDSRVMFGQASQPHWVMVPWESVDMERAGIWLVQGNTSGIGGEETAGIFMDNSNGNFSNQLKLRGMNGGGVEIFGRLSSNDMYAGIIQHSGGNFKLQGANGSYFSSQVIFNGRITYAGAPSTTSAGNAHIASDGTIWKSSSASRFKIDQKVSSIPDSLLNLKFKDWLDKGQLDQYTAITSGPRPFNKEDAATLAQTYLGRVGGVVAEDVVKVAGGSAELFVTYDKDGRLETVAYDRLGVALVLKLTERVNKLAAELAALKGGNL